MCVFYVLDLTGTGVVRGTYHLVDRKVVGFVHLSYAWLLLQRKWNGVAVIVVLVFAAQMMNKPPVLALALGLLCCGVATVVALINSWSA